MVTEYRAQILQDARGERFTAPFPEGVTAPVQYGNSVKVQAVYPSQFQLIPYKRVEDYFAEQLLPISAGSLYHFNQQAWQVHSGQASTDSSTSHHQNRLTIGFRLPRLSHHCVQSEETVMKARAIDLPLGELEVEVMDYLWHVGESDVRQAHRALSSGEKRSLKGRGQK